MNQYFDNYSAISDVAVVVICIVLLVLMRVAYITKTQHYMIFKLIVFVLLFCAFFDLTFHYLTLSNLDKNQYPIYIFRFLYLASIYFMLVMFVLYAISLLSLNPLENRRPMILGIIGSGALILADILGTILHYGFYIKDGEIHVGISDYLFLACYVYMIALISYVVLRFRKMIYKRVLTGVVVSVIFSVLTVGMTQMNGQNSCVALTFLFPIISILYLVHSNPYDLSIGALNRAGFEDIIKEYHEKGRHLILMSLYIPEFSGEGKKYPEEIRMVIRDFTANSFNNAILFQVENGHMVLVAPIQANPNYEQIVNRLLNKFAEIYPRYKKDYKIIITDTIDEISRNNEYVELLRFVHGIMSVNSIRRIQVEDIEAFRKHEYIVEQLEDIAKTKDLKDDRVVVYCQPVYNIETQSYDTAEALMRLKLPRIGLVFPDQFIPVAEERGIIHILSMIILNKTCQQIRTLTIAGYYVRRISVNFAVSEFRDDNFCTDITRIISDCGIPSEKIAIEITESQNEADFNLIKSKIAELHDIGIKFYLDDFGTGYSNIERIMELPFDIIKFDRSLVLASASDKKSAMMVGSLASMFSQMEYSVLFEGVENEQDEQKCIRMAANYLQGYKYSRPIPIERLTEYFMRNGQKSGKEPDLSESPEKGAAVPDGNERKLKDKVIKIGDHFAAEV